MRGERLRKNLGASAEPLKFVWTWKLLTRGRGERGVAGVGGGGRGGEGVGHFGLYGPEIKYTDLDVPRRVIECEFGIDSGRI